MRKDRLRPDRATQRDRNKNPFLGAAVARGCDCAPAARLPQNMGTAHFRYPPSAP